MNSTTIEFLNQKLSEGPVAIGEVDKNGVELRQFDAILIEDQCLQIMWSVTAGDYAAFSEDGCWLTREGFREAEKIGSQEDWTEYDDIDIDHVIEMLKISRPNQIIWQRTEEFEEIIISHWTFRDKRFGLLLTHKLKEIFGEKVGIGESLHYKSDYDFFSDDETISVKKREKLLENLAAVPNDTDLEKGEITNIAFEGTRILKFAKLLIGIDDDLANLIPNKECYCSGPKKQIHFGDDKKLTIMPRVNWEERFVKEISEMNEFLKGISQ